MICNIIPLHENFSLLDDCCNLLNKEWKKSYGARCHTLKQSNENFPCNLVLLIDGKVSGHVRLSRIVGNEEALFLTAVIVDAELRGCGVGKKLMFLTEEYAGRRGYKSLYLSSEGAATFYEKCGYEFCDPVQQSHFSALDDKLLMLQKSILEAGKVKQADQMNGATLCISQQQSHPPVPPPPPPPPPPLPIVSPSNNNLYSPNGSNKSITWMRKTLSF